MTNATCPIEECTNEVHKKARGMCWNHHIEAMRERHNITPIGRAGSREKLVHRFWSNVEKGPGCWEWHGHIVKGHGTISLLGKTIYAHRLSYELAGGEIPDGMQIDHMCHNRSCVNPDHLRVVTPKQNNEHRAGSNPNNTSGAHGVSWRKDVQKWQVTIKHENKTRHVGYFTDIEDAREAARLKRLELFTHNDRDRRAS